MVAVIELGGGVDQVTATVILKVLLSTAEVVVRSVLRPVVAQPGSGLVPDFAFHPGAATSG